MSPFDFLQRIQQAYNRKMNEVQHEEWIKRLNSFSDAELEKVFDWIVENCTMFPAIARLFEAAKERGLGTHRKRERRSPFSLVPMAGCECRRCHGIGLLHTWHEPYTARDGEQAEHWMDPELVPEDYAERVVKVMPAVAELELGTWFKHHLIRRLWRCDCAASGRQPKIPRFSIERERRGFAPRAAPTWGGGL